MGRLLSYVLVSMILHYSCIRDHVQIISQTIALSLAAALQGGDLGRSTTERRAILELFIRCGASIVFIIDVRGLIGGGRTFGNAESVVALYGPERVALCKAYCCRRRRATATLKDEGACWRRCRS